MPRKGSRREGSKAGASRARRTARPRHGIADALFTVTQQRVLGLVFGEPDRKFSLAELIALADVGSGSVQREMRRLVEAGLVSLITLAGRKLYSANRSAPVFEELRRLVEKTIGIPDQLRQALQPLADRVRFAILYGSLAKGTDSASSDIDLLVVSDDLALDELYSALEPVERRVGRRINPTLYRRSEFIERRRKRQPFLTKVLAGKHEILTGSEESIEGAG